MSLEVPNLNESVNKSEDLPNTGPEHPKSKYDNIASVRRSLRWKNTFRALLGGVVGLFSHAQSAEAADLVQEKPTSITQAEDLSGKPHTLENYQKNVELSRVSREDVMAVRMDSVMTQNMLKKSIDDPTRPGYSNLLNLSNWVRAESVLENSTSTDFSAIMSVDPDGERSMDQLFAESAENKINQIINSLDLNGIEGAEEYKKDLSTYCQEIMKNVCGSKLADLNDHKDKDGNLLKGINKFGVNNKGFENSEKNYIHFAGLLQMLVSQHLRPLEGREYSIRQKAMDMGKGDMEITSRLLSPIQRIDSIAMLLRTITTQEMDLGRLMKLSDRLGNNIEAHNSRQQQRGK